jgi:hypothetical protein
MSQDSHREARGRTLGNVASTIGGTIVHHEDLKTRPFYGIADVLQQVAETGDLVKCKTMLSILKWPIGILVTAISWLGCTSRLRPKKMGSASSQSSEDIQSMLCGGRTKWSTALPFKEPGST